MRIKLKKMYKYLVEEVDNKEIRELAHLLLDYTQNGSMQDFDEDLQNTSKEKTFVINKEQFLDYMAQLQLILHEDDILNAALRQISPDFGGFHNEKAISLIVDLLKNVMHDTEEYADIDYFIWELNWGKDYRDGVITEANGDIIKMGTASELYDCLTRQN